MMHYAALIRTLAAVVIIVQGALAAEPTSREDRPVTNEELAGSAHITVFTTSRLLSRWQRDHTIAKRRGKLLLRSQERLLAALHGRGDSTLLQRNDQIHTAVPFSKSGGGQLVGGTRSGGGR